MVYAIKFIVSLSGKECYVSPIQQTRKLNIFRQTLTMGERYNGI